MTDGFVEPAYGVRSLVDVLPAVALALGRPLGRSPSRAPGRSGPTDLELPEAGAYVVLLVDGLGARQLARHAHAAPYLSALMTDTEPATVGVPSTTASSLTSFGTALPPGGHGLVGFTARVPGTDQLLNHLQWDADVDPMQWQPHPTALGLLAADGVAVTVVNKREFRKSGLTVCSVRGGEYVAADKTGERIAAAVEASSARPSLTYLYDSDLDWTGHKYGVASSQWLQQLAMVDAEAEQLREALPADRRLLVVADHGMVDGPPESRIDVDEHPELLDGVALVGGEARFRHLYCRSGAVDDVRATWQEMLDERAEVWTREEAVQRGWFGPVEAGVAPRVGDVVVACRGDHGVFSSQRFRHETGLVGLHGSLTAEEMLVPLLCD